MENCMLLQYIYYDYTNKEQVYKHHTNKRDLSHTHTIRMNKPFILAALKDDQSKDSYMHTRQNIRHIETNHYRFNHQKTFHTSHLNITSFIIIGSVLREWIWCGEDDFGVG